MTLEQNIFKFNIEKFKQDFKNNLEEYTSAINDIKHTGDYSNFNKLNDKMDELAKTDKRNRADAESRIFKYKNQLISLSINALKSVDNKKEVLEIISSTFLNLDEEDIEVTYCIENGLLQEIVLELLRTK